MSSYSVGPAGEKFPLPGPDEDAREFVRVQTLAAAARAEGKEVVVVMGVGFVGAVMAAIVADAVGPDGKPGKFVIGCQRPSARSYWKIPLVVRTLTEMGAEMCVHDPYVDHWYELENQADCPAPGHSWSRFFRNQAALSDIRVQKDLARALAGAEALILAVRHKPYLVLEPDQVVTWAGAPLAVEVRGKSSRN